MPTAYLSASQLKELTDVSVNPGAEQDGYPLVWSNTTGRWIASLLPYSSLSGAPSLPIPVASGGTGTQTGSITGTGPLTFTPGGTNQNVNVVTSGTGKLAVSGTSFSLTQPANTNTAGLGIEFSKRGNNSFFRVINATGSESDFLPYFFGQTTTLGASLSFVGIQSTAGDNSYGVCFYSAFNTTGAGPINNAHKAHSFQNYTTFLVDIFGSGDTRFYSNTESTLTTNGAIRVDGGVGIAKNLNVGGTKINFSNLPTTPTGLSVGDLWRDGENVKVKI